MSEFQVVNETVTLDSELIVGVIAAVTGIFVVLLTAWLNQRTQREIARLTSGLDDESAAIARREQHALDSLDWFDKGTRRRTMGLSVIVANWKSYEHLRDMWTQLLVGQALYLLCEATRKREEHEAANLDTILTLLQKSDSQYLDIDRLSAALKARKDRGKGIELNEDEEQAWVTFVKHKKH
jgi:hypothetical protein